jgi:hypothetical protein
MKVSYPSPAEVARRYGLDADLAGALESIDVWTGARGGPIGGREVPDAERARSIDGE